MSPVPSERWSAHYADGAGFRRLGATERALLTRYAPAPEAGRALDVGCGTGELARFLAGSGYRVDPPRRGRPRRRPAERSRARAGHPHRPGPPVAGYTGEPTVTEPHLIRRWEWHEVADLPTLGRPLFTPSAHIIDTFWPGLLPDLPPVLRYPIAADGDHGGSETGEGVMGPG
ncbi:hypothetical protein ABZ439_25430 [Streptomyces sp. NPDC005840]|uniref:hypothetical protein n=1 Tax=Streptomyces sp. NPDC005840 TaxID=3157072 RepID=UPI0033EC8F57